MGTTLDRTNSACSAETTSSFAVLAWASSSCAAVKMDAEQRHHATAMQRMPHAVLSEGNSRVIPQASFKKFAEQRRIMDHHVAEEGVFWKIGLDLGFGRMSITAAPRL